MGLVLGDSYALSMPIDLTTLTPEQIERFRALPLEVQAELVVGPLPGLVGPTPRPILRWQAERVGPRGGVTVVFCARQDGQTEPPANAIWCQTQERAAKPRWPAR